MRNKRMTVMVLCSVLLLAGCGKGNESSIQTEDIRQVQNAGENDYSTGEQELADSNEEDDSVVIAFGPDRQLYEEGSIIYTLHDFKLYGSPGEASVSTDELVMADAEYYADRSKFLTVLVDIHNIDYAGDNKDDGGEMNISCLTIAPNEPDEALQWEGSYPVYLKEPGTGETDYYHVWVKPGETKTVMIGFYVPVKDVGELRSQCKISLYGSYEEGYVYEIPKVQ
jgi:hypothetical protein